MILNKIFPNETYEYQSEMVPTTDYFLKFFVIPEPSNHLLPVSNLDKQIFNFNQIETKVIRYE